jgi:hypothetical protein
MMCKKGKDIELERKKKSKAKEANCWSKLSLENQKPKW